MKLHFNQAVIIGVGLIGGSLGMILRRKQLASNVVGVGRRIENLKTAVSVGAIDRYVVDPREAVKDADLVILATPVDTYESHLKEWASCLRPGAIVTDVGSVKGDLVVRSERQIPRGVHFVGAHPIAGKEKTGAAAGSEDLFSGRRCILTPTQQTDPQALEQVQALWQEAGAVVLTSLPTGTYMLYAYFAHIPDELLEAARIDGAGEFTVLARVVLPLSFPGLIAVGVYAFMWAWNDLFYSLTIISSKELRTVGPGLLLEFFGEMQQDWGAAMAASFLASAPVVLVFAFLQRFFIQGLTAGAVKA